MVEFTETIHYEVAQKIVGTDRTARANWTNTKHEICITQLAYTDVLRVSLIQLQQIINFLVEVETKAGETLGDRS